jgi:hypothetical protein
LNSLRTLPKKIKPNNWNCQESEMGINSNWFIFLQFHQSKASKTKYTSNKKKTTWIYILNRKQSFHNIFPPNLTSCQVFPTNFKNLVVFICFLKLNYIWMGFRFCINQFYSLALEKPLLWHHPKTLPKTLIGVESHGLHIKW